MNRFPKVIRSAPGFLASASLIILCACSRIDPTAPGTSLEDVQRYYSKTKWYWSDPTGLPAEPKTLMRTNHGAGIQVVLVSPGGRSMVRYTELRPARFHLLAFHGKSRLHPIEGLDVPLYRGGKDHLVGFFRERCFRLEVISDGGDGQEGLRLAMKLGVEIIESNRQ